MARGDRSAAAYRHVDISCIPDEHREEIIGDADTSGREFGLQIVEIVHNGPAQTNIYGVYKHDEDKWLAAKVEFGIEESGDEGLDLTSAAQAEAEATAAEIKAKEAAEIAKVTKK